MHNRAVDEYLRDMEDCQTWRDVHNFMFTSDQRTYTFVLNQLMRMLGVKRKKKKVERRRGLATSVADKLVALIQVNRALRGTNKSVLSNE